MTKPLPNWMYKLLIVIATIIWGFSFVVMKDAVDVLTPAWLIGVRFGATAIVLTVVLWPHLKAALDRRSLVAGCVLGVLNFLAFWTQTVGLAFTTPGKNAFLTATYCVMVPFVFWLVGRKRPSVYNLVAAVLCVAGMGFVSLTGDDAGGVAFGDLMTLVCAVFFAVHIVFVGKFSQSRDVLGLTVLQFWVGGILGVLTGLVTEGVPTGDLLDPAFLFNMAYLVIFASCIALVIQNVALAHVAPTQASLLLSLESVFGVLFSVLCYGETLTLQLVTGFALIFAAIIISEVFPLKPRDGLQENAASEAASVSGTAPVPASALDDNTDAEAAASLLLGDNMAAGEYEQEQASEASATKAGTNADRCG